MVFCFPKPNITRNRRMILRLLSVFVSAILTAATASSEIETRVLNDGNLILEGIPEIDSEIVESLRNNFV